MLVSSFVFDGGEGVGWFGLAFWVSLTGPGWPRTQSSHFLCLLIAETKGMFYHDWWWGVSRQLGTSHSHLGRGDVCWENALWESVAHFLEQWLIWEGPGHSGWCHLSAIAGCCKKVGWAVRSKPVSSVPPCFVSVPPSRFLSPAPALNSLSDGLQL